jgi:hypothetical protein
MTNITTTFDEDTIINIADGMTNFRDIAEYIKENVETWIGRPVIWDLSDMDFAKVTSAELAEFVRDFKSLSEKKRGEKTAVVAPEDLSYGMMRVFQVFAEMRALAIQLKVFRTIDEAKKWISE